jgi:hypothetical protein
MTVAQLAVRHQATLADLSPAPYPHGTTSDSLYYWHQAASFAAQGMGSGYYTAGEQTAPAAFSPFYTWGMFVPAFYGSIGAVIGWQPASIPIINLVLLTLALALYMRIVRPNVPQLLLLGGFIITSNALHIQYATSMTTVLHLALATVLAGGVIKCLFKRLETKRLERFLLASLASWRFNLFGFETPGRQERQDRIQRVQIFSSLLNVLVLVLLLLLSTLLLPTWGTLFVFGGALLLRGHWARVTIGALLGGAVFAVLTLIVQSTGAPFANPLTEMLSAARISPADGLARLLDNISLNLGYTFQGSPVEIVTRLQTLVVALMAMSSWLFPYLTPQKQLSTTSRTPLRLRRGDRGEVNAWEAAFHALNLGSVYVIALLFYEQTAGRDYRLFAPRLLLSALVLVGMKRYRIATALLLTMALILPNALYDGGAWAEAHISRDANAFYQQQRAAFAAVMPSQPDASSRWCNTLLMSASYLAQLPALPMAVPPGIGLSWGIEAVDGVPRARYLLLSDADYAAYPDQSALTRLLSVPEGALYQNGVPDCQDS